MDKLSNEKFVINGDGLKRFCELSVNILNKQKPRKKRYATGNQMPVITKELSKEIMTRPRLRNNYVKNRIEENGAIYERKKKLLCISRTKIQKKVL